MLLDHIEVRVKTTSKATVATVAEEVMLVIRAIRSYTCDDDQSYTLVWEHTDGIQCVFKGDKKDMTLGVIVETYYQTKEKNKGAR